MYHVRTPRSTALKTTFTFILDFFHFLSNKKSIPSNRIAIVWDARAYPLTYDVVFCLFYVALQLNPDNLPVTFLLYIPDDFDEIYSPSSLLTVSRDDLLFRAYNLVQPLASLHSSVEDAVIIHEADELRAYTENPNIQLLPKYYSKFYIPLIYSYKDIFRLLGSARCPFPATALISTPLNPDSLLNLTDSLGNKTELPPTPFITFTLRDYGLNPERNTSQRDIDIVYRFALSHAFALLIIPDCATKISSYVLPTEAIIANAVNSSLRTRAYLYSRSTVNILRASGPANLSYLIETSNTIVLDWGTGSPLDGDILFYKKNYGITFGSQPLLALNTYLLWATKRDLFSVDDILQAYNVLRDDRFAYSH